jgi:hypothetical protein
MATLPAKPSSSRSLVRASVNCLSAVPPDKNAFGPEGSPNSSKHGVLMLTRQSPFCCKPAMDAMRDLCRERFEQFGTAGNASRIKVIPLSEMAKRYRSGALEPRTEDIVAAA